jgi:tRNA threonylcarbamoyladenosine biosynthesis protein TsaB
VQAMPLTPQQKTAPVLALDTCSVLCSVALGGNQTSFSISKQPRRHADDVLIMVQQLLSEQAIGLADCSFIAMVSGPGSFTGLRIGAAVCQGLAFGSGLKVIPVSALALMARRAVSGQGTAIFVCLQHAREDEYFLAVYQDTGDSFPVAIISECVVDRTYLENGLADELYKVAATLNLPVVLCGMDWELQQLSTALAGLSTLILTESADARDLLSLAEQLDPATHAVEPELATPVYLKEEMAYRTVSGTS